MQRRGGFGAWATALVVLVGLGGAVPYGLLSGDRGWFTALFWLGFGLAVVLMVAIGVRGWRER